MPSARDRSRSGAAPSSPQASDARRRRRRARWASRKAFPGVLANDDITLALRRGEVHCLLGENGAGKSTLIGHPLRHGAARRGPDPRSTGGTSGSTRPAAALELGIGTVYQHSTLIPALTVLENLMLGDSRGAAARRRRRAAAPRGACSATLGVDGRPGREGGRPRARRASSRSRSSRRSGAARASSILDEPTSMLTPQGVAELAEGARAAEGARPRRSSSSPTSCTRRSSLGDRDLDPARRAASSGALDARAAALARTPEELQRRDRPAHVRRRGPRRSPTSPSCEDSSRRAARAARGSAAAEVVLELERRRAPAATASQPGIEDVSLDAAGRARSSASPASTATGSARSPRSIAGQRRADARRDPPLRRADRRRSVVARARSSACATSPTTASARASSARCASALNLVLKRIGQRPFWRHGRIQRAAIERDGARARRRSSTSARRASRRARRHALGRQHPEGPARARAARSTRRSSSSTSRPTAWT